MTIDILASPPPDYDSHSADDSAKDNQRVNAVQVGRIVRVSVNSSINGAESVSVYYHSLHGPHPGEIDPAAAQGRGVEGLKRSIAEAERISDPQRLRTVLYEDQVTKSPMDLAAKLNIFGDGNGPGKTPATALALAVNGDLTPGEYAAVNAIDLTQSRENSEYLYYRLYTWAGEDSSTTCFDPTEPAVGRLERFKISPPIGPSSIKRVVAKSEGKPIYLYAALYEDVSADVAMADGGLYPSINSGTAGSNKERAMKNCDNELGLGEVGHTDGFLTTLDAQSSRKAQGECTEVRYKPNTTPTDARLPHRRPEPARTSHYICPPSK
ncbi:hypothetical protein DFH06DRAFT_1324782 [Mycena polygramma]|nr:hypothetical protein DFH06DRAFT_1324782 [Mycena polygramma]